MMNKTNSLIHTGVKWWQIIWDYLESECRKIGKRKTQKYSVIGWKGLHLGCRWNRKSNQQENTNMWSSLVVQRLRISFATQQIPVQSLVREVPTCLGATKPACQLLKLWLLESVLHERSPHNKPTHHN